MRSELRQRLRRKMRGDRVLLHGRAEFVPDLFVDCFDDFFAGEHKKTFRCSFTYAGQQNRQSAIENAKAPRSFPSAGLLFWRRPIDSLAPARSADGLPVYVGAAPRLYSLTTCGCARVGDVKAKGPMR